MGNSLTGVESSALEGIRYTANGLLVFFEYSIFDYINELFRRHCAFETSINSLKTNKSVDTLIIGVGEMGKAP